MKALLICPSERIEVRLLSEAAPLAKLRLMGQSLIEYWLAHLAATGFKDVKVLADDRPEQILEAAGTGARWGLSVDVIAESRELSRAQALLKYGDQLKTDGAQTTITVLDHFPALPEHNLFTGYNSFWSGLLAWLPRARTPERVGITELRPGVFVGTRSRISPGVTFNPPCWVGQNVIIRAGAVIGPEAIIDDNTFLEHGAEIRRSYVAGDTFVGRFARLSHSLALGSVLINWQNTSAATVPDPFLLCALRSPVRRQGPGGVLARLAEFCSRSKGDVLMAWKQLVASKEG